MKIFIKFQFVTLLSLLFICLTTHTKAQEDSVLVRLLEGNQRFIDQKSIHPHDDQETLMKTSNVQMPFAVIHTCADSRLSPELIFDQGLGDLFVTRVAGNIIEDGGLGSIEYAIEHLNVTFILVLGHSKCGAVTATISGDKGEGHISWLVEKIRPAYLRVLDQTGDKLHNTIIENIKQSVEQVLKDAKMIDPSISGKIRIAGGIYHVENGSVEIVVPPKGIND